MSTEQRDKEIISQFCTLLEKSREQFDSLRSLPQFEKRHWKSQFAKAFDVYTKLWKFQQENRAVLDLRYNLKRWQIGEIASKIGQLYYHYYLRTSESSYLQESYQFYSAIRNRAYFSQWNKDDRSALMVKKLRYYARYIVVALLLNYMELVRELLQDLKQCVNEYNEYPDADSSGEWQLVMKEASIFIDASNPVTIFDDEMRPVALQNRLSEQSVPHVKTQEPLALNIGEIIIVGSCAKQVKFSELTIDMFRMLQVVEHEPTGLEKGPMKVGPYDSVGKKDLESHDANNNCKTWQVNPHKYLLYKPTFGQLHTFLSASFKDLPQNSVLLLYLSADAISGSKKDGNEGLYEQGGIATSRKNIDAASRRQNIKDPHCFYPEDLIPFTRKPLLLIVDSEESNVFLTVPKLFGQPIISLVSAQETPTSVYVPQNGNLFTLFLYNPLVALCSICGLADIQQATWTRGNQQVLKILTQILQTLYDSSRELDVSYEQFLEDEFLRLLILRFIFCWCCLYLHKEFKGSRFYPNSSPKLPQSVLQHRGVCRHILELTELLSLRDAFYGLDELQ